MKKFFGMMAAALLGAGMLTVIAPRSASAIQTPAEVYSYGDLGSCKVRLRVYGQGSADVTLQTAGDPTSGGSLFINGRATPFLAINAQHLAGCGITQPDVWTLGAAFNPRRWCSS
jgi:hypothetical protein